MKQIYIKARKRRTDEFQFFMHNFVDECIASGFMPKPDILPSYKWHIRAVCRRLAYMLYTIFTPKNNSRQKALIVTANGGTINDNVFPYLWGYEIIPVLWDVWPTLWEPMFKSLRLHNCKLVFVTSHQVARKIEEVLGIKAIWIPEGIDASLYKKGNELIDRPKDILELGRRFFKYHQYLQNLSDDGFINLTASPVLPTGRIDTNNLLYKNDNEMAEDIANHKLFVCFPNSDTQPDKAQGIETLTQRYWEGMLSRCVLVGRAPQELIDLIGYNPVVDINWSNPEQQILDILGHIDEYQSLVDKNQESAIKFSSWQNRISMIKNEILKLGYNI